MQEMPQNCKGVQGGWLSCISMQEYQPQVMPTSPLDGCFAAVLSAAIAFFLQQQPCCRAPGEPAAWHQHAGLTVSSYANISTRMPFRSSIISGNSPFLQQQLCCGLVFKKEGTAGFRDIETDR